MIETGTKIFRFFVAASFDSSSCAVITSKAIRIQKIVPCTDLSSFIEVVSEPSNQPSNTITPVKNTVINIPKSNRYLSIISYFLPVRLYPNEQMRSLI